MHWPAGNFFPVNQTCELPNQPLTGSARQNPLVAANVSPFLPAISIRFEPAHVVCHGLNQMILRVEIDLLRPVLKYIGFPRADVAELADALDSKSSIRKDVWVRPPPSAPL